jgi:hypothetical protein
MGDNYIRNDHWVIDDRSGLKIRSSEARREWTGAVVHKDDWEARHPQDFVRAKPERAIVRNPRPRPVDTFQGPLDTTVTVAALPGSTTLTVASSVRMEAGDFITVMLDNGEPFRVLLLAVPDSVTLSLFAALPAAVSVGNMVYDNTAMSHAVLP